MNNISIGIGGEAGAGIIESGNLFTKYALLNGLNSFVSSDYPSLIRGGHNFVTVHLSVKEVRSISKGIDLLIALNQETIDLHKSELNDNAAIIFDKDKFSPEEDKNYHYFGVPLTSIAKESGAPDIIRNTVAIGVAIGLLKGDFSILEQIITKIFAKKGQEIIDMNVKSALKGYHFLLGQGEHQFPFVIEKQEIDPRKILMTGNDGLSIGAIKAGMKFSSIYPMTPITGILDYFAAKEKDFNLVVKEVEDEISAIMMAIGAAHTGVRALTATSGGGFCLMTEGMGLAGMTETPLVVIEGMRGGPSTGLPTKSEQSDLLFLMNPGHGEFPVVVVAPGDAAEAYSEIFNAFNLADKFQLPVIVVTDKNLASSVYTTILPDDAGWKIDRGKIKTEITQNEKYARYQLSEDGVSPRALPGTKNAVIHATSDEHDEFGFPIDDPKTRNSMVEKRLNKIESLSKELPEPVLYGPPDADLTIIGWGSTKGPILDALDQLSEQGYKVNFLQILYLKPFPAYTVSKIIDSAKSTLIVENTATGQINQIIKQFTCRRIKNQLLKYDGMPFTSTEIVAESKKIIDSAGGK